jgi:crotonobetainyl-CoA:carnitine CoA-transferase CaiB-like acyl-CoA transferase
VSGPLEGVRVLDLTRLLPGNYCTLLLADLGADVIKVEQPERGDYIRWLPPLVDGEGAVHRALNRGKRSLTLNLKESEGAALLKRLVTAADVLVESFRPGVLERLGVGYDVLGQENPKLVYCALTGYGQDGPYRDRAGHDINYTGLAGVLHATGDPEGPPMLPSVQIGDFGGGMAAAVGILAALHEASSTGRGRLVDVSMLDVVASWGAVLSSWFLASGAVPERGRMPLSGGLACYRVYRAGDGRYLAVGALEPQFWRALCERLGLEELVDPHLDPSRQEEIAGRLTELFATRSRDEWVEELADLDTCVGPVNDVAEAIDDPHARHRGMIATVGDSSVGPGPAIKVSGHAVGPLRSAPRLGEHTEEVLGSLGIGPEEIASLRTARVL